MKAYRIVEDHGNGIYKTLFHGVDGTRTLPIGEWMIAKEKTVRDGSGQAYYKSGFHSLENMYELIDYMKSFKKRKDILKIAEVTIKQVRPKPHSRANVLLSAFMRVDKVLDLDWQNI